MRKMFASVNRIIGNRYVLLVARVLLGAIFILAAAGKLPEQAEFVDVVTDRGLLPTGLAIAYGFALPWVELFVGICLVTGLVSRLSAGISLLMIISFIIANGTGVYEWESCECFGGDSFILLQKSDALIMDAVMSVLALLILVYGAGIWSIDSLIRSKLENSALSTSSGGFTRWVGWLVK